MIEKVNPKHPDKVADRIAGAIVDLAYRIEENPKVAVEVLIGHGEANVIIESDIDFTANQILPIVERIGGENMLLNLKSVKQDVYLAANQSKTIKCGDNGIFKGVPLSAEERELSKIAHDIYEKYDSDGKYVLDKDTEKLIICQSNATTESLRVVYPNAIINPLGDWTGGTDVDTGATNRKLGSDMGHAVTGGGLHGKDISKADVSVNIYAFLKAQELGREVNYCCAIGDTTVNGIPYDEIVEIARKFISDLGGFEKLAEWGLF
jgi:S-adenosylmethionine synthetase